MAVKETVPEEDPIDTHIFNRIICPDEIDSDDEEDLSKKGSSKRNMDYFTSPEMDDFIFNLAKEQRRLKSKSLTTIYELQNNENEGENTRQL